MKLYYYDHCPYCTRVRLALALLSLDAEHIVLANDDEDTPIRLIGKKLLPILLKDDGTAMGESLDIVAYLNELSDYTLEQTIRPDIQHWLEQVAQYANRLVMPREIRIGLAEFATPEAVAYFEHKKSEYIGDFAENISHTDDYLTKLQRDLAELSPLILADYAANGETTSLEDIVLFPVLRNLTCVKGVQWPDNILQYLHTMSKESDIPLWLDIAI